MKKGTLIIWVIIFGFMALVLFQNKAFFLETKTAISLNLGITEAYQSPELPNAVLVLFFFVCGIIIAYLFSLSTRFKAKRMIKKLNTTVASHLNELSELKSEISKLKGIEPPVDEKADTVTLDMNATQKIDAESSADKTVKFDTTKDASSPGKDSKETTSQKK